MESRMNDIYGVRNNVLTECEKMLAYVNIIKNKTDDLVNYIKQLDTQHFFKQYTPVYKHLHELNEKLVEQNCEFELFFLDLKEFPSLNDEAHNSNDQLTAESSSINISQFNDNVLETNVKTEKLTSSKLKQTDSEVIIKSTNETENILENNATVEVVEKTDKLKIQRSLKYAPTLDNILDNNATAVEVDKLKFQKLLKNTTTLDNNNTKNTKSEETQNDETGVLNVENLMEKLNKRTLEREQKTGSRVPDLRPIYIKADYYESSATSSTSEHSASNLRNSRKNQKKKPLTHVRQNVTENKKTVTKDIVENNIVVKPSPVPKEGALCYVSHIESPSNFYIQIVSEDNSLIDYLSNQIEEVLACLKLYPTKLEAKKKIQDYCVCYIAKTNCWYRAKILSWLMENDELISVQLIDYGNTCFVALRNVREAIPYFFALNVMATKCKIAWVKPPNNAKEWPNKSIDYFRNLLCSNEDSLYFLSYVQQDRDQISVDLQNSEIVSLAGDLISNKVAVDSHVVNEDEDSDVWCNDYMKDQIIHSQGFSKKELKMSEEEKLQHDLEFDDDEEHTDPTLAVAHYRPRDETQICRIYLANGYCFKGDNCRFAHTPLNPDGWTTDREAVYYDAFNKLVLPENGDITVKVISIVDLRTYYVVIKNLPQNMVSLTQSLYDIKSLVKYMNEPSEVSKYKQLTVKPAYGELILVKYNNEKWQRGKILECYEYCNRVELDIFLVDFGVVLERINMKTVRAIRESHLHLPFQAIMCCLANARMKDNLTEEENDMGSDYLEINILHKKLKATLVYSSSYLNIHLFNEEGNDIGEELIKAGIVEKCPLINLNRNNHILID